MTVTTAPFGTYTAFTTTGAPETAKIVLNLNNLIDLVKKQDQADGDNQLPSPHPDFDAIKPATADLIVAEINAIIATAGPTV